MGQKSLPQLGCNFTPAMKLEISIKATIENHCAARPSIDLHVRNIECSEPTLYSVQNKRPFSPVKGIRIVPWDGRKNPPPKSIDPNAIEVARRKIEINRLAHSAQVINTSWHDVRGQYDLILAHVLPSVLFKAVHYIAKFLKKQALLISAGFPVSRNTKVLGLFEKEGLRLINEFSSDGWGGFADN
jgi:hypothetical protein